MGGTIAAVRNELTHRRSADDTFPGEVLHWLTESVYQVLRVCLLKECITNDVFDRLVSRNRGRFTRESGTSAGQSLISTW